MIPSAGPDRLAESEGFSQKNDKSVLHLFLKKKKNRFDHITASRLTLFTFIIQNNSSRNVKSTAVFLLTRSSQCARAEVTPMLDFNDFKSGILRIHPDKFKPKAFSATLDY